MRSGFRFVLNTMSNWTNRVLSGIIGLFLIRYVMDALTKPTYGVYAVLGSILAMMNMLDLGLSASVSRFSSQEQAREDYESLRQTASTSQAMFSCLGLAGMVILAAGAPLFERFFKIDHSHHVQFLLLSLCMGTSFFLSFACLAVRGTVIGSNRFELINLTEIVGQIVRLVTVISLFEVFGPSLALLGLSLIIHEVIRISGFLISSRIATGHQLFSPRWVTRVAFKRVLGFGSVNALNVLSTLGLLQAPNIIIGRLLGTETVALYAPSQAVAANLRALLGGLSSPLTPMAGKLQQLRQDPRALALLSLRATRLSCIMTIAILMPLFLFARSVLFWWMGEDFTQTSTIFIVASLGAGVTGIQAANYYLTIGAGNIWPWALSQTIVTVVAVILSVVAYLLAPSIGLLGIVSVFTVLILIRQLWYLPYITCRSHGTNWWRYMRDAYGRPLTAAVVPTLIGLWLTRETLSLYELAGYSTLVSTLYLGLCWFVALGVEDRSLIMDFAGRVLQIGRRGK